MCVSRFRTVDQYRGDLEVVEIVEKGDPVSDFDHGLPAPRYPDPRSGPEFNEGPGLGPDLFCVEGRDPPSGSQKRRDASVEEVISNFGAQSPERRLRDFLPAQGDSGEPDADVLDDLGAAQGGLGQKLELRADAGAQRKTPVRACRIEQNVDAGDVGRVGEGDEAAEPNAFFTLSFFAGRIIGKTAAETGRKTP